MKEKSTSTESASTVCYETMEAHARLRIQSWLQDLLEAEVREFLGRGKSQRCARFAQGMRLGYRNGYGKPRRVALTAGTITVRRPRMRNLAERFESRVLPLFKRRTAELGAMLPQLYLHGLSSGDFELALLEPQDRERAGRVAEEAAARGRRAPEHDDVCREPLGLRA